MDTLITYLRRDWGKDPQAIESVIQDLLEGALTASQSGVSAKGYFGADPQVAADAILAELPRRTAAQWRQLLWPLANFYLAFAFLEGLLRQPMRWTLGDLRLLVIPFVMVATTWFFRGISFNRLNQRTKRRVLVGMVLFLAIPLVDGFVGEVITFPSLPANALLGVIALMLVWDLAAWRKRRDAAWWVGVWGVLAATVVISQWSVANGLLVLIAAVNIGLWLAALLVTQVADVAV
jgi:antibiotic biosynthesis monooxygenase (ABM) superfamily enzyme